jgi:hypothetical protein
MESIDRLRAFASAARESGDIAAMCRLGVYNEVRAGSLNTAKGWYTLAAEQGSVPALHQLTRLAVGERDLARAHTLLRRIGLQLAEHPPVPESTEVTALTPPRSGVDASWVVDSDWSGETSWVGVAPDVLGSNLDGQGIEFDWSPAYEMDLTGNSLNAEVFTVVTPDPDRARDALEPVVEEELPLVDMDGNRVASFDEPFRIKLPRLDTAEGGLRVSFDARGEVRATLGRAVVVRIASALRQHHVPALVANLSPAFAMPTS